LHLVKHKVGSAMNWSILGGITFIFCVFGMPANSADLNECKPEKLSRTSVQKLSQTPLPLRNGPRVKTSGRVPHVQVGVKHSDALYKKLVELVFTLPDLEKRPTIVSISGLGMWLADSVSVVHPKAIVSGREFAHIHTDGSLHAPLPLQRAVELEKKGWGERHPWADQNDGWEGLVMLYSASTEEELATLIQLITESYNHVTGRSFATPSC